VKLERGKLGLTKSSSFWTATSLHVLSHIFFITIIPALHRSFLSTYCIHHYCSRILFRRTLPRTFSWHEPLFFVALSVASLVLDIHGHLYRLSFSCLFLRYLLFFECYPKPLWVLITRLGDQRAQLVTLLDMRYYTTLLQPSYFFWKGCGQCGPSERWSINITQTSEQCRL